MLISVRIAGLNLPSSATIILWRLRLVGSRNTARVVLAGYPGVFMSGLLSKHLCALVGGLSTAAERAWVGR